MFTYKSAKDGTSIGRAMPNVIKPCYWMPVMIQHAPIPVEHI